MKLASLALSLVLANLYAYSKHPSHIPKVTNWLFRSSIALPVKNISKMKTYCTQITIEKTSFGKSQNLVSNLKSEFNFGKILMQ